MRYVCFLVNFDVNAVTIIVVSIKKSAVGVPIVIMERPTELKSKLLFFLRPVLNASQAASTFSREEPFEISSIKEAVNELRIICLSSSREKPISE